MMKDGIQRSTAFTRVAALLGVVTLSGAALGCAAKVNQDVFDETIAELRGDIQELDGQVAANSDRITTNEEMLAALRGDLEALAAEFDDMQASITEIEDGIRFAMPVHFEFDRDEIRPSDRPLLDRFARVADRYYPAAVITVEGFADPAGSVAYNLDLSERRAQNVADYLTGQGGLDAAGVKVAGYGEAEDRQVVPGAQGPGLEGMENRRVTFVIELAGDRAQTVATIGEEGI